MEKVEKMRKMRKERKRIGGRGVFAPSPGVVYFFNSGI